MKRIRLTEGQLFGLIQKAINEVSQTKKNRHTYNGIDVEYVSEENGSWKDCSFDSLMQEIANAVVDLAKKDGLNHKHIELARETYYETMAILYVPFYDDPVIIYIPFRYVWDSNYPTHFDLGDISVKYAGYRNIPEIYYDDDHEHCNYIKRNLNIEKILSDISNILQKEGNTINPNESLSHRVAESIIRRLRRLS